MLELLETMILVIRDLVLILVEEENLDKIKFRLLLLLILKDGLVFKFLILFLVGMILLSEIISPLSIVGLELVTQMFMTLIIMFLKPYPTMTTLLLLLSLVFQQQTINSKYQ